MRILNLEEKAKQSAAPLDDVHEPQFIQNNKTHIFLPLVVLKDSVDAINLLKKKTEIKIQNSNLTNVVMLLHQQSGRSGEGI